MLYIYEQIKNCFMITYPECTADAVTTLCDEQVTAVRSFCADMLISNGQQSIKSSILAQCKASNQLQMT